MPTVHYHYHHCHSQQQSRNQQQQRQSGHVNRSIFQEPSSPSWSRSRRMTPYQDQRACFPPLHGIMHRNGIDAFMAASISRWCALYRQISACLEPTERSNPVVSMCSRMSPGSTTWQLQPGRTCPHGINRHHRPPPPQQQQRHHHHHHHQLCTSNLPALLPATEKQRSQKALS